MSNERKPPPPPGKNPFPKDWDAIPYPAGYTRKNNAVEQVARDLGATPAEAAEAAQDAQQPMTTAQASLELGDPAAVERARQKLPYECGRVLARFRTVAGRRRLVSMLAKELSGEEIALSPDVLEAVDYLLQEDAKQAPDARPIVGVADGKLEFARLLREVRKGRGR
jgi:hypothetical protein